MSPRSPRRSVSSGITSSGGMFPRLTSGPMRLHEPRLRGLRRRLEDHVRRVDGFRDLRDQLGAHAAGRVEDAGGAALARLGDHLPRAGVQLLAKPARPFVRRVLDRRVLRPHLGENGEVAREVGDQLELPLARDVDRPVGDLDVRQPELSQPRLVLVELALRVDDLEERPADHHRLLAQHLELALEVRRDVRGAPAELDDVDVDARGLEHVLPPARAEALVDHVGQAAGAWLKVEQRAPSASPARAPARRGRASCRARRSRRSAARSP